MTAKRFEEIVGIAKFIDNETGKEYSEYNLYEIVELLNEQHETIERLKQNIDELMQLDVEEELLKENEQLKQKNTMLNKDLKYITDRKNHLESEWDKFYELVDKKIKELEDKYEFGRTEYGACPMHNIMFGINVLKELQNEIKGDVE